MGKGGKKPQRRQNYFNLQFQQLGEGWTGKITTLDVRKSALRLFKDIANGNIDLDKDVQFFNEPSFTYNLKLAADDNAYHCYTLYYALYQMPNKDQYQVKLMDEYLQRYNAYSILSQSFNTILNGIQFNGGLQTKDFVADLIVRLNPSKYLFNGYFITINRPDDGKLKVERRHKERHDKGINTRVTGPVKGFTNPSSM